LLPLSPQSNRKGKSIFPDFQVAIRNRVREEGKFFISHQVDIENKDSPARCFYESSESIAVTFECYSVKLGKLDKNCSDERKTALN
jgi:hypothetical protein